MGNQYLAVIQNISKILNYFGECAVTNVSSLDAGKHFSDYEGNESVAEGW